jgi:hypothetical protein
VGANGKVIHADQEENADLFGNPRRGREFRNSTLIYPIAGTRKVLTFVDKYMMTVPDEFDVVIDVGNNGMAAAAPRVMQPVISLLLSYCGDIARGELALRPLFPNAPCGHDSNDAVSANSRLEHRPVRI